MTTIDALMLELIGAEKSIRIKSLEWGCQAYQQARAFKLHLLTGIAIMPAEQSTGIQLFNIVNYTFKQ
jgi:hypothetical protein